MRRDGGDVWNWIILGGVGGNAFICKGMDQ